MKKWLFVAALAGSASGAYVMLAHAATTPEGPFRKSCKQCSVNGKLNTLFCTCNNAKQQPNHTSLKLPCDVPINNCNGVLRCGPC